MDFVHVYKCGVFSFSQPVASWIMGREYWIMVYERKHMNNAPLPYPMIELGAVLFHTPSSSNTFGYCLSLDYALPHNAIKAHNHIMDDVSNQVIQLVAISKSSKQL